MEILIYMIVKNNDRTVVDWLMIVNYTFIYCNSKQLYIDYRKEKLCIPIRFSDLHCYAIAASDPHSRLVSTRKHHSRAGSFFTSAETSSWNLFAFRTRLS